MLIVTPRWFFRRNSKARRRNKIKANMKKMKITKNVVEVFAEVRSVKNAFPAKLDSNGCTFWPIVSSHFLVVGRFDSMLQSWMSIHFRV